MIDGHQAHLKLRKKMRRRKERRKRRQQQRRQVVVAVVLVLQARHNLYPLYLRYPLNQYLPLICKLYILLHGCRMHTNFMNEGDISLTSERSERVSEMSPE